MRLPKRLMSPEAALIEVLWQNRGNNGATLCGFALTKSI